MASEMSNKARVGEAFELLAQGLEPFVARHMGRTVKKGHDWAEAYARASGKQGQEALRTDPGFLLDVMIDSWARVFRRQLPQSIQTLLATLRSKTDDLDRSRAIQNNDAQFTLSGIVALLEAIDAREADQVRISLDDLNRSLYEKEQERTQEDGSQSNVLDAPQAGLKPWREVILPHPDVSSGAFTVAEFAADLELVRKGEGSPEYADPVLFFERTFLTKGLRDLLTLGVRRVAGTGGQPVINCQTNFGGGKTHSLIALYHLLSGVALDALPDDVQHLVRAAGLETIPAVQRAVVVGNRFAPGQVHVKGDGTEVHTIWGEIAHQLAGAEGYALVAEADRTKSNPGDAIRDVLKLASPCLVLIDEWVAYARELYARDDLAGGTFDSQFGFAQALTEAVRGTTGALFVVSIPASADRSSDGEPVATSLEVGGVAGREALERLTNVVTRQAEQWQPARGDESFEIVRRRLFQPLENTADRDATAERFGELYRAQPSEFPSETNSMRYVERIKTAYPIHPEVFDRLYEDWSTVERFQRTRGVLRLMAATISSLWESDDRSPLILPCSIPLDDARVSGELAGKLPDYWAPVIDADIDGPSSRAAAIDRATPHLGAHHATRRVARTIFLGATPNVGSVNRGIELDRIRLGSVFAGEKPGFIADALGRLAAQAPYLYVDRDRYWFDRQQNVTRTARDDAERLLAGDRHEIHAEIVRRLRAEKGDGDFRKVHHAPASSADVADDPMARLVVLGPESPHIAKTDDSPALRHARNLLDTRATSPRTYRNMLVFAACDQKALEAFELEVAQYLAWSSICARAEELNLDVHQAAQARSRRDQSADASSLRLTEAYRYVLVPRQDDPVGPVTFDVSPVDQQGSIAQRASRRMALDGTLAVQLPPVMLRLRLDTVLARRWEDGHVAVQALWEDMATYIYLPRLRDIEVLLATAEAGPASTVWESEGFAVAASFDSASGRYLGLVTGSRAGAVSPTALLVRPEFALGQVEAEDAERGSAAAPTSARAIDDAPPGSVRSDRPPDGPRSAVFRGTVALDPDRPGRHFGDIHKEVIDHLAAPVGAEIEIIVSVVARKPGGYDDHVVRTATENARTLKFDDGTGFSED